MKEVAAGILNRGRRILICQRKETAHYPLKWEFPGGKLEQGETPVEALTRELREELGIEAVIGEEFWRQEWEYPDTVPKSFRVFYYRVTGFTGTMVNQAFRAIRWVDPEELARMDILDGNKEAVRLLVEHETERTRQAP